MCVLWPTRPALPELTLLGTLKLSHKRSLSKPFIWLKRVTPSTEAFLDHFRSWGRWLQSAFQPLGIIQLTVITVIFLVHCILSKTLNTFSQALNTKQMISLTLECQERNKENDRLKNWEPGVITCEYHRDSAKKNRTNKNFKTIDW